MNRLTSALFLAAALAAQPFAHGGVSDEEAAARKIALDLAGAFGNDGFKLRDGHWTGSIESGKPRVIVVNLFAGNQYWFSLGTTPQAKKLTIAVFDEAGKPVATEPYADESRAAAGFAPEASGPYFLKIEEAEGQPATFCLLYSYK